jgi:hypothetical protein
MENHMKKTILLLTFLLLLFGLTACKSESTAETVVASGAASDRTFAMPVSMQLMMGTVKLDETDYAIDAQQASELLPLWKALRSLSESDTAAQAEVDALIAQIQETMTPEQMQAITDMGLTMQDFASVAETLGIEAAGFGGRFGDITPEMQATMEAMRSSGEFPGSGGGFGGGDFPGGGPGGGQGPAGGFGGGAEMDPSARATAIAERGGAQGTGFGLNTQLLDGVIGFLEAKVK